MSSEERLRHAPFLTVLDVLTILKQFLLTSKHLAPSTPARECTKSASYVSQRQKGRAGHWSRMALHVARTRRARMACMIAHDAHVIACREFAQGSMQFDRHAARPNTWSAPAAQQQTVGTPASRRRPQCGIPPHHALSASRPTPPSTQATTRPLRAPQAPGLREPPSRRTPRTRAATPQSRARRIRPGETARSPATSLRSHAQPPAPARPAPTRGIG